MLKTLTKVAAAAALSLAFAPGIAAAKTELKLATIAPEGTPWYAFMDEWAKNVAEASNGEMEITIFPSAQLGNEWEVWTKVVRGRVDIGVFSGAVMAEKVPPLSLMSTPFLFDSEQTIYCVYDTQLKDEFTAMLEEHAKVISWAETGWAHIYAKDDLSDVAAAEGYKTRVAPHAMSRLLWSSAGANGVEIPYADTPAALQTGLVRSGESTAIAYVAFGLTKVAPHYMLTRHMHQAGSLLMGKKTWAKLSEEEQRILVDSVPDVNGLRAGVNGIEKFMLGKYTEAGGPVHELTPEQRAAWKAKVEANYPAYVEGLGAEAQALWPRLLQAKAACGE
jgi:TRAP-type C4-dicarboxylate transport system substrate-binding protein